MKQSPTSARVQEFEQWRPLLFSIAYRMLGSAMEAEDIVQEAYLRYAAVDPGAVRTPRAYLTTIVTRLCLDQLKSARVQREQYIGPWLPEPVATAGAPEQVVEHAESITMAFLVLLEQLSPVERAVFLLREVFDYPYAEIAAMVEKSEENCRQLFARARRHLAANRPRFQATRTAQMRLVEGFMQAVDQGSVDGLTAVLAEDVQHWSDGGGKVAAAARVIHGRAHVMRLILGLAKRRPAGLQMEAAEINGTASLVLRVDGRIVSVWHFGFDEEQIHSIRAVVNPDKLRYLQRVYPGHSSP